MALFTCSLEFGGGTYLTQVRARSIGGAVRKWAAQLKAAAITGLGDAGVAEIRAEAASTDPTPVAGLLGVWCCTFTASKRLALLHIVETAPSAG